MNQNHRPLTAALANSHSIITAREREVLQLLAQGCTNREIATALRLSVQTVGTHIKAIYGKLEVHSRVEALIASHKLGLIQLDRNSSPKREEKGRGIPQGYIGRNFLKRETKIP
jgi:DNA-binding NarL/FixJ family response regulator